MVIRAARSGLLFIPVYFTGFRHMSNNYRIGIIGHTGRGNYGHGLDHVWSHVPKTKIVAVSDPDESGRRQAIKRLGLSQGFADYRKMLDEAKPDIVSICPRWPDQHRDMVVATAERGIHIYMEKPLCRALDEADEMVAACEAQNVKLAIAFQTRYSPKLPVIRDLIEDGQMGELLELRGRGKEDHRGGGEDLWVLGSHIMNLMHYFAGEPKWCTAAVRQNGKPVSGDDVHPGVEGIGPLAGDVLNAMYGLPDGVTGYFASHRNTTAGRPSRFGLKIFGSRGVIDLVTGYVPEAHFLPDPSWSPGRSGKSWLPISSQGVDKPEPFAGQTNEDGNVAACHDLIAAIEEDRQPEASIYEARQSVEMIASVFEAHRLGKPVSLPLEARKNPLSLI